MKTIFGPLALLCFASLVYAGDGSFLSQRVCGTLQRVGEVTPGLYHGSKPRTEEDFKCLRALNIHTLVSVEDRILLGTAEGDLAQKYDVRLLNLPMVPSPVPPREKTVQGIMDTVKNRELWPLYFHCYIGRDRTMLIVGLYENQVMNKSAWQSWEDMQKYGFSTNFTLWGLEHYFWEHVQMGERPLSEDTEKKLRPEDFASGAELSN